MTADDIRDPTMLEALTKACDLLRKQIYDKARDRLVNCELYLTVTLEDASQVHVSYYFVDHANCQLFWADDVPLGSLGLPALNSDIEISEYKR